MSLLIGASVAEFSGGDPARHAALAACIGAHARRARVHRVAGPRRQCGRDFFSETVLVGFKSGVAFYLASTQLPEAVRLQADRMAISGSARRIS